MVASSSLCLLLHHHPCLSWDSLLDPQVLPSSQYYPNIGCKLFINQSGLNRGARFIGQSQCEVFSICIQSTRPPPNTCWQNTSKEASGYTKIWGKSWESHCGFHEWGYTFMDESCTKTNEEALNPPLYPVLGWNSHRQAWQWVDVTVGLAVL